MSESTTTTDTNAVVDQVARDIEALVAAAPRMTAEQRDKLRRVFRYGPPEAVR